MTELNLEQSEKADYLLEIICNSDSALGIDIANGVFDSNKERDFVFSILKKLNLITIITATEGDPFYLFSWNENTCHFLKSEGGFTKKYHNANLEDLENKLSHSNENKEFKMGEDTLQTLENLKNGKSFTLTKDSPNEISELVVILKNLGILHKPSRFRYACDFKNRKYLTRLIKLQSWKDFLDWLDEQNTESNITNDFSGSTIGQINQSESLKVKKTEIKQTNNPVSKEKQQNGIVSFIKKFWWQILIPILVGIVLIIIEKGAIDIGL